MAYQPYSNGPVIGLFFVVYQCLHTVLSSNRTDNAPLNLAQSRTRVRAHPGPSSESKVRASGQWTQTVCEEIRNGVDRPIFYTPRPKSLTQCLVLKKCWTSSLRIHWSLFLRGSGAAWKKIEDILISSFSSAPDREFAVCNGMVYVGRYHPLSMQESQNVFVENDAHEARTLEIGKPNYLQGGFHWTQGFHTEHVPDHYVEIEVLTSSLDIGNAQDLDGGSKITGSAKILQNSGLAGTVRRNGSGVEHVSVSDRIMAVWPIGSITTHVVLRGSLVVKMPETWSFEQAASVPASFVTAIRALIDVGHLSEGQSILLQSPASNFGHAALLTARAVGAETYIIAESEAEAQFLIDTYGFPKERVYQATVDLPTVQSIQETESHGMDVVVNWSRNDLVIKSACKFVARYGKFVEACSDEFNVLDKFDVEWFSANRSYYSVNLAHFAQDLPWEVYR